MTPQEAEAWAADEAEIWMDLGSVGDWMHVQRAGEGAGFMRFGAADWHPEQHLFETNRTGYDIVLKGRQMGFSTLELARDLQFAICNEGVQVLIVTHDFKESAKFFGRLKKMYESLGVVGAAPEAQYSTKQELVFSENGSGIYITEAGVSETAAQKTGRSGTVHRLHATEVAFWGSPQATWTSLQGACEHGSEIVMETTANGADTWFHDVWTKAEAGEFAATGDRRFRAHFYPWFLQPARVADPELYGTPSAHPRERMWEERHEALGCTPEQIAWWRMKVSAMRDLDKTLQEYPPTPESAFASTGQTWIEQYYLEKLEELVYDPAEVVPLAWGELRLYARAERGRDYFIASDPSEGIGRDASSFKVFDWRTFEPVAAYDSNTVAPKRFARVLHETAKLYNYATLSVERNGRRDRGTEGGGAREPVGLVVLKELASYPNLFVYPVDGKPGWPTDARTRPIMLHDLLDSIQEGFAWSPDRRTIAEARGMHVNDKGKIVARAKGTGKGVYRRDDGLFMSWAQGLQVRALAPIPGRTAIRTVGELSSPEFRT